jgi:methionyl-tRNA synthetase
MRKVLIDLNKNITTLNQKFIELLHQFYNKQMRKLLEKLISRSSKLFFDIFHALEQFNLAKATELMLEFLDEADAVMDDLAWRMALKPFDKFAHTIRELLQVIRAQVIFLDQYRQSYYAF